MWITQRQQLVHVVSEWAAVTIAAPFLRWAASGHPDEHARLGLRALADATDTIDMWLLSRWEHGSGHRR